MDKYEPNSHAYKKQQAEKEQERKKNEKVISGTAKVKKKSELRKFAGNFISEDASSVKSYLLGDIVIPWVKDLVVDVVTDGINLIVHGERAPHGSRKKKGTYISYDGFSKKSDRDRRSSRDDVKVRQRYSFDDIYLETRREAEDVLNMMDDHIEQYDAVSVADLYDFVGITGNWTDNKYGWTNLRSADVQRTRDGYLLKLPDARPLD